MFAKENADRHGIYLDVYFRIHNYGVTQGMVLVNDVTSLHTDFLRVIIHAFCQIPSKFNKYHLH